LAELNVPKIVEITIDREGSATIDVHGTQGEECIKEPSTQAFEALMGEIEDDRKLKPAFYAETGTQAKIRASTGESIDGCESGGCG
jgi:hypothetical protein